jgi:heme o synthase
LKAELGISATLPGISLAKTVGLVQLTKPRLTVLVVATTLASFYLGARGAVSPLLIFNAMLGTALVAGGASAFNMYLERHLDLLMRRTSRRPLPSGRVRSSEALLFAAVLSISGLIYLYVFVNPLTSLISAITSISYIFLYTPLKTRTWLCTMIGAVPGALPTLMGWSAVTGGLSPGAWILFAILFFWQIPHFYAVAWMYREDYARAGFPMLAVVDVSGSRTVRQAVFSILALIAVAALPAFLGIVGIAYLVGGLVLGLGYLVYGVLFALSVTRISARKLFVYSLFYLPALLFLLMVGKITS